MLYLPWRVQVLGGLSVGQGDRIITRYRTYRTGALLAYLVCHSKRAHPREELIDLFWPDSDIEPGRASLRTALASLRRQLEPPGILRKSVLIADHGNVRLNPESFTCDLADFEAALAAAARATDPRQQIATLSHAVELYKGPLLPGYYQDWVIAARESAEAAYVEAQRQIAAARTRLPDGESGTVVLSLLTPVPVVSPSFSPVGVSSLPSYMTRFFGRTEEVARLCALLVGPEANTRLLTLLGPGGCGKTRLAIRVAEMLRDAFGDAVWFAGLSDLQTGQQIPNALLETLALPRSPCPLEQIIERLSRKPCLLVLDNFEHLLDPSGSEWPDAEREDGASFLETLLQRVPTLSCLVTSRQRLGLSGEREFSLPLLPVPNAVETPENLMRYACVQMFVDRAQATLPDFQITPGNAKAVATLCVHLEGLPLAIELAAAWAQTLTPAQMAAKLEKRFDLLKSHGRSLPARHRTLHATLDWSHRLLSPELQRFFVRLSIFRGGWTPEAAAEVCEEPRALAFLRALQERSLIIAEEAGQERRFRLLETLREFGWEHLSPLEREALQERRADYCLRLVEASSGALSCLEREHENLRRSLAWCQATGNAEKGLRLAVAWRYFWMSGYSLEGDYWIKYFLTLGSEVSAPLQAEAMLCAGMLSLPYTDFARAQHFAEPQKSSSQERSRQNGNLDAMDDFVRTRPIEVLEGYLNTAAANGDPRTSAFALCGMGNILHRRGESVRGRKLLEESLALYRTLGDSFGLQLTLNSLGSLLMEYKDYADAVPLFEESLAHCRAQEYLPGILRTLWLKGTAQQRQGNRQQAESVLEECLSLCREQGDQENLLGLLRNLGFLAMERADYDKAHTHFAEGLAIAGRTGHQDNSRRYLRYMGVCALEQREYAKARAYFEQHLALCQGTYGVVETASSLTDIAFTFLEEGKAERTFSLLRQSLTLFGEQARMHYALEGIARLAVHAGKMAQAATLFGRAESLREMRLVELPVVLRVRRDPVLALACEQIGEEAFRQAWTQGRALSQNQAFALAMTLVDPVSTE